MKQIGSVKGVMLLSVSLGEVALLLAHVSGALLTWVTLLVNGRGVLPTQNKEKLQRG